MTRFFIVATYMTAGGNHGSTGFAVAAPDMDTARSIALRKVQTRGRRKINISIHREA